MFPWKTKPTELESLFESLGSYNPERRYQALIATQALPSEQFMELVRIAQAREKRSSHRILFVCTIGAIALIGMLTYCIPIIQVLIIFTVAALSYVFCQLANSELVLHWRQDETILGVLESSGDRHIVAPVLYLLGAAKGKRCARLLRILQRWLPELRADDAREWTTQQREVIVLALRFWHLHTELACAILKAMPEIGGTWALESVERLAKLAHWNPDRLRTDHRKVRRQSLPWQSPLREDREPTPEKVEAMLDAFRQMGAVAAECLPGLRAKIQNETAAQVLLRAAPAANSAEELLRAAGDTGVLPDTTNLLRPGAPAEEIMLTHRQSP